MKPRLGFGRRQDAARHIQPEAATGDIEVDSSDDEDPSALIQPARTPNEAPIRPDLGPPAPGPQSAHQPGSGLGLVVSIAISAIVFVLAIYATGSPTTNPLPLAQTTNALFWGSVSWTHSVLPIATARTDVYPVQLTGRRAGSST